MRKKMIAGNWKMNIAPSRTTELIEEIQNKAESMTANVDIVVCPPFPALDRASASLQRSSISLGAQDLHWENDGAYTGKVSASMLTDLGVEYVILGHSEQRTYFGETDDTVNLKAKKAMDHGLIPVVCVGETLEHREKNITERIVEHQVRRAFWGISQGKAKNAIIAYEPVWAIGTGKNATPEQAQDVHAFIRKLIEELYGSAFASEMRILYGGSMKPDNARGLLQKADIDGGLIGGASLKADQFAGIIAAAQ